MNFSRNVSLGVALLAVSVTIQCEPHDQFSPPATPQNAVALPPPPDSPPPTESEGAAATTGGEATMYASDEVSVGAERDGYDDDDPAALTDFHSTLDPHGSWVDDATYGTAWVPSPDVVGPDFQPYVTAGHWAYDDDWVWVSDYNWGWAPFHYGRWVWIGGRGWAWIPGRVYRGAWVEWGVDDGYGYVGWAPMAPAFVWFGGAAVIFPGYVGRRWVYCPRGEVFSPGVRAHVVAGAAAAPIAARVRPYVPATPGVGAAGPPPQRMGYQAAQIPHASGAAGVVHAQQFSRPATAQPLGASAPSRIASTPLTASRPMPSGPAGGQASRAVGTGAMIQSAPGAGRVPPPVGVHPSAPARASVGTGHTAPAPVQTPRPAGRAPSFHGGGGGHHR